MIWFVNIKNLIIILYNLTINHKMSSINNTQFSDNFTKCVTGYHFINTEPVNETVWEAINCQVLELSGCPVQKTSSGSHSPGQDILCGLGG